MPVPDDSRSVRREARPVTALRLSPAEAADFGLDAAELRRLAAMTSDQIRRRNRMAHLAGLDPARLEEEPALDLATALCCTECAAEGRCRMAVDGGALPEDEAFCANAATFRALAAG